MENSKKADDAIIHPQDVKKRAYDLPPSQLHRIMAVVDEVLEDENNKTNAQVMATLEAKVVELGYTPREILECGEYLGSILYGGQDDDEVNDAMIEKMARERKDEVKTKYVGADKETALWDKPILTIGERPQSKNFSYDIHFNVSCNRHGDENADDTLDSDEPLTLDALALEVAKYTLMTGPLISWQIVGSYRKAGRHEEGPISI